MGNVLLRDILIIFAVAIPVVIVAHKLRFPSIVGFLVTGAIIGPHGLQWISDIENIHVLAEVGVAMLLFSIGLEFSWDRLKGFARESSLMGIVQVCLTTGGGWLIGRAIGLGQVESAIMGAAIALSSTAIVLAVLAHKRWFDAPAGRIATGILILQDLAVIPIMVILKFVAWPRGTEPLTDILSATLKLLALGAALFVASRWVLKPVLRHTALLRSKELFVVVIVGVALAAAYFTDELGFSFALGAFLAGLLVSTTEFRYHALSEIAPFRHCFHGLFFVAAGMIFDGNFILENAGLVSLVVTSAILLKILLVAAVVIFFGYPVGVAVVTALMLAQVGEFSFMLIFFAWKGRAISLEFYQLIIDSAALTMVIAPFFVAAAPAIGEKLSNVTWRLKVLGRRDVPPAPEGTGSLRQHAIICGFGPLGMTIGTILERHQIPFVVLELNPVTAQKLREKMPHIYVGDGASHSLLTHSGIEHARLLAIAVPDYLNAVAIIKQARSMNPGIFIVTRSRYRNQVDLLYGAGADVVISEELEGGIEMGRYILLELGVDTAEISRLFKEIRDFGSADFF